jgi:phosphoribosylformylglycinamidine cyclo-ligase
MDPKKPIRYKDAGVDIEVADLIKRRIRPFVSSTHSEDTLGTMGFFGGVLGMPGSDMALVASIDGVGTKTIVAQMMNKYDSIGHDIVNHCVNDILCQGALPLFFLDYYASEHLEVEQVTSVVSGIASACRQNGIVLIGGETAEMPSTYAPGKFDLVGVIVGILKKSDLISGSAIESGDALIGLPSSGLHTNGYSLARKVLFEKAAYSVSTVLDGLHRPLGEVLLEPHLSYVRYVKSLMNSCRIRGIAHITGGGIEGNLSRILPEGIGATVELSEVPKNPIFEIIQETGSIPADEMYRTFNMGIGLIICVRQDDVKMALSLLESLSIGAYLVGETTKNGGKIVLNL